MLRESVAVINVLTHGEERTWVATVRVDHKKEGRLILTVTDRGPGRAEENYVVEEPINLLDVQLGERSMVARFVRLCAAALEVPARNSRRAEGERQRHVQSA